jgi:hypothetical protein
MFLPYLACKVLPFMRFVASMTVLLISVIAYTSKGTRSLFSNCAVENAYQVASQGHACVSAGRAPHRTTIVSFLPHVPFEDCEEFKFTLFFCSSKCFFKSRAGSFLCNNVLATMKQPKPTQGDDGTRTNGFWIESRKSN